MKQFFAHRAALVVSAVLLAGPAVARDIPAALTPPAGATEIGAYEAKGLQIYICAAHGPAPGAAMEWTFKAPEAQLVDAHGAIFAEHYAGPTWEAPDGSKVVGKMLRTVPSPTAGAIPWLLLSAQPSGRGVLADVRFVQRIKTTGGTPKSSACSKPGAEQRVPYAAEYVFYR